MKKNKPLAVLLLPEMIGLRADKALSLLPEISTRSRAEWLIKNNHVLINSKSAKSSHVLKETDQVEILFPEPKPTDLIPLDLKLDILFEDNDLIVINKPSGIVVHPAAGHEQDTLVNALLAHTTDLSLRFGETRPGIVHRLDKETSGILVIAKNDRAHEFLARQFKERTIHRIYYALTFGTPPQKDGTISSYLARHPTDRKKFASARDINKKIVRHHSAENSELGKWAQTNYFCLGSLDKDLSYFRLKLQTGRTHQIRVHLSELGCPIVGDLTYGADKFFARVKGGPRKQLISEVQRCALHAAELAFVHPKSGETLFFSVDWPEDIRPTLDRLGFL